MGIIIMPLTRGDVVGYDSARMTFRFTMTGPNASIVRCEVSGVAMDLLAGIRGILPAERETQFLRLRDQIERVASDIFDQTHAARVTVFAKHFLIGKKPRT
jgi:Protein of unknown function (DUF1488)